MDILVASRLAAHPDPVLRLAASLASGLAAELTLLTVARDAGAAAAAEDALADARAQLEACPARRAAGRACVSAVQPRRSWPSWRRPTPRWWSSANARSPSR